MTEDEKGGAQHPDTRSDWLGKARSRAYARSNDDYKKIPPTEFLIATVFGAGLSPVASGTVGSIVAVVAYLLLPGLQNISALALICLVVLLLGTWSAGVVERILEKQDPGCVVVDEVLGQWIALMTVGYAGDIGYAILAFLAFRAFDIVKIWPARYFERREGGLGIMLDDAVAGIYANIASHVVYWLFLMWKVG